VTIRRHAKPTADERNEVRHPLRLCWRHVGGPLAGTVPPIQRPVERLARAARGPLPPRVRLPHGGIDTSDLLREAITTAWRRTATGGRGPQRTS
jgi:hypothetical protein